MNKSGVEEVWLPFKRVILRRLIQSLPMLSKLFYLLILFSCIVTDNSAAAE